MADDDNFDIDIYGDDPQDYQQENQNVNDAKQLDGQVEQPMPDAQHDSAPQNATVKTEDNATIKQEENGDMSSDEQHKIASTGGSSYNQLQPPKQAPIQQGTKRKEGADDRPVDHAATTALLISELHWWTNEDDVRGWANQSGCEDELVDVTFNEHKVNGKSKGQVFVELSSPQAATALKSTIESFGSGQTYAKKHTVVFHQPHINPYRTLPKDVPNRKGNDTSRNDNRTSSFTSNSGGMSNNFNGGGGFRGGRGGFNANRGNMAGYNANRSFSPMGGMQNAGFNPMGGFAGNPMAGGMNMGFNNFNRGGGMMGGMRGGMGARGGRGGMNGGMGGMPMGGMGGMPMGGMGGMGMPMGAMGGMGMGMGGMQGGFAGAAQPHFNPAFFGQGQATGGNDGNWNPHGNKRPRPE
ncbi:hypothetical protein K490DRAFT_54539 [Saccharata proteae CBS 121410]|uniref:RRM domain-containing protein n=1 Tax=Saccharata proteae CBS 121410 TaxID=1314787 RepID=A0A9P4HZT5_9PEZI|nr:hypothetical protein K490DRAFT_54539 [Saccharata proteae CBS 121410]